MANVFKGFFILKKLHIKIHIQKYNTTKLYNEKKAIHTPLNYKRREVINTLSIDDKS